MASRPDPRDDARTPQAFDLATLALAATAAFVIAQQVAGKAVRDAFYLTHFHVDTLPRIMIASALVSIVLVFGVSTLLARHTPRSVLPLLFLASAVGLLLEWLLSLAAPRPGAVAVYLHCAVVSPILITTFWSHVNEQYDPYNGKRAVARIAGGGTLGGLLGGLLAWRASSLVSLRTAILGLALLNLLAFVSVLLSRGAPPRPRVAVESAASPPREASALAPLALLLRAPFLRNLAFLVAGGAAVTSLLDYVFTAQATAAYGKGEPLLAFFSLFGLAVGVVSLAVQLSVGRIAAEKVGVVVNIGILPGVILLGGALGLAVPGLASSSILRGGELVYRNTLFRAAYELIYTPVSPALKRATKAVIDVGFDRLGTMIGATLTALAILTLRAQPVALGVVVALALLTGVLVRSLHRGYVTTLEEGLRDGMRRQSLGSSSGGRLTLDEERAREQLIAQAEALGLRVKEGGRASRALGDRRRLSSMVVALSSRNPSHVKKALAAWHDGMWPLAPFAIALLGDSAHYASARSALLALGPGIAGQLVDALTSPEMDVAVRRRVPRILSECGTQAAASGLLLGITDARFEVRYACGRALLHLTEQRPEVVIGREKVIEVVLAEARRQPVASAAAEDASAADEDFAPKTLVDVMMRERVARNVEHLFTVLALISEREPLRLCLRALHGDDARHRGTALEYLQTVLPAEVRDAIWPLLGDAVVPLPAPRPAREVLAELAAVAEVQGAGVLVEASSRAPE